MKADRALVSGCRDGFHTPALSLATGIREAIVKKTADPSSPIFRMNPYQMHISRAGRLGACRLGSLETWRGETEQKTDHVGPLFDDQSLVAELVIENRVSKRADGAAPPVIDDFHDAVEVALRDVPHVHGGSRVVAFRSTGNKSLTAAAASARCLLRDSPARPAYRAVNPLG